MPAMKRELHATLSAPGTPARDLPFVLEGPLADGRFELTTIVDGQRSEPRVVDAKRVRGSTWSIIIDNRSYVVDVDKRRNGAAFSVNESDGLVLLEDAAKRRLSAAAGRAGAKASGETLRAPIAGKVVKVLVAPGDVVAPGTAVVVLEAMKMENEIVSERGGTVATIGKLAGQAVDIGDMLVDLK
jgi:acetyl-CoA/propionyl-CoA carboxylase biotin carboxyl carrier protein